MFNWLSLTDYIQLALMIFSGASATIGFLNRRKFNTLKYFYIYPFASFIQIFFYYATTISLKSESQQISFIQVSTNIFLLIEFISIYAFFYLTLKARIIRLLLLLLGLLYISIFIYWISKCGIRCYNNTLFLFQAFVILLPTIYYFLDILINSAANILAKDPNFWVATGILLYFGCTLPMFLMLDFIKHADTIATSKVSLINHFCYFALYMLIIKAYMCPKTKILN